MNRVARWSFCILGVLVLAACPLERSSPGATASLNQLLPPDLSADVPRSGTEAFEFKTLVPVDVSLTIRPYEQAQPVKGFGGWKALDPEVADAYLTVTDSRGERVYAGRVGSDGTFSAHLVLPAAPEDLTFTLHAQGFEERSFVVKAASAYARIDRAVSMAADDAVARNAVLPDRDGDSVPDVYDAFPDDPESAFAIDVPFDGPLTIAFEDLFGRAQAGDADYNDFIANYRITEYANGKDNAIVRVEGTATSIAKIAGYNHDFCIAIDSFTGGADLTIEYPSGAVTSRVSAPAVIPVFVSTKDTVGQTVSFSLHFDEAQPRATMDEPPYNPFLHVRNTGYDIHLIGEEALPGSKSAGLSFQDAEGFPWALLVPAAWEHPLECQRIEVPYPRFTLWRESFGARHTDWYLHYYDPYVPPVYVHVAGYYNAGTDAAALWWKEDASALLPLHDKTSARATAVSVSGTDVYVAGYFTNAKGNRAAAYWKVDAAGNVERVVLYSDTDKSGYQAQGNAIAVSGTDVYVAGWVDEGARSAVLWKNGAATVLHGTDTSDGLGIAVSGADVYVAGYYSPPSKEVSCWWKVDGVGNVTKVDLYDANYSRAAGITVSGTDVFGVGYYIPPGGTATACTWKNGGAGRVDLSAKGRATSVFVSGTDVYVAGYYLNAKNNNAAAYWKNGAPTVLYSDTTGTSSAQAFSITVLDGVVYTAGQVNEGTQAACYWKDLARVELYPGGTSLGSSIAVTK